MAEQVRIEIGFDGGQSLSMLVSPESADELERGIGEDGSVTLDAEDAQLHRRSPPGRLPAQVPPRGEGGVRGRVTRASSG